MSEKYFVFKDSQGSMVMVPCNTVAIEYFGHGSGYSIYSMARKAQWTVRDGVVYIKELEEALKMVER